MLFKKELLEVPLLKPEGLGKSEIVAAVVELPRSGRILVADYITDRKLNARFFCDGKNFKTVFSWPEGHWSEAHPSQWWTSYKTSIKTDKCVRDFFGKGTAGAFEQIYWFIQGKGSEKRQKTWDRKEVRMKAHFALFPELPQDLEQYCEDTVFFSGYLFFSRLDKRGRRRGRCGCCGKSFWVRRDTRHNDHGTCPRCGRKVQYKGDWYKACIQDAQRIAICYRVDDQLLIRWTDVVRSFCYPEYKRKYLFEDMARNLHLHTKSGDRLYGYEYKSAPYSYGKYWEIENNTPCVASSFVYTNNLREVFGERHYNVDMTALARLRKPIRFHFLLNQLRDTPAAEYLFKAGMFHLAEKADMLAIPGGGKFSFQNCLGVSGQYRRLYGKLDITYQEHLIISRSHGTVTEADVTALRGLLGNSYYVSDITDLFQYMSLQRFLTYFGKQKSLHKTTQIGQLMTWYRDYRKMAQKLGVDMTHKGVQFPADIKDAHDRILTRMYRAKMEVEDKEFTEQVAGVYQSLPFTEFAKDGLCIRLPRTASEFVIEGTSLSHCVGSEQYRVNHLAGTDLIFFIRKTENPEKPFFTMELGMRDLNIKQLYGYGDCKAPKEVRAFANAMVQALKKSRRKTA